MSTAEHPQTDGQTERMNRVLVDLLKSYAQSFHNWSDYLPMTEFAINNAVHASTGHTPFFLNAMRHPPLPSTLGAVASSLTGGGSTVASEQPQKTADTEFAAAMTRARARARTRQGDVSVPATDTVKNPEQATPAATKDNVSVRAQTPRRLTHRPGLLHAQVMYRCRASILRRFTHRAITHKVSVTGTDTPKNHAQAGTDVTTSSESVQGTDADKTNELEPGFSSQAMDFVHERQAVVRFVQDAIAASADRQKMNADNNDRVSGFGASKLAPRFIGPFTVAERHGNAYTLELPSDMRLHPTFYVKRLKPYLLLNPLHLLLEKAILFQHLNTDV
ncbi:hypothetical protein PHMEG_00038413 [Phytophthora megakarya]|uniref:Integrase catalytic domain-containing protein n=1 Tax=Phytophthora megakarya TaxID=4795 RepID=A0A225UHL5_9STRA|nr:hypothetical protein PHMEG_00038413 [Phytophthora megakarya]